jgi:hypothetical protein
VNDEAGFEARAVEGLEHLQSAALEVIAAARVLLDVAERAVREPGAAATIVQAAAGLGRVVLGGGAASAGTPEPPTGEGKVRRIDVS